MTLWMKCTWQLKLRKVLRCYVVVFCINLSIVIWRQTFEWLKQHSAHPHEVDHQLSSAPHIVCRSFKPRPLSRRRISSNHRITTLHWIASSSPGLFSTIANWMLFLQLVRNAFTAALRCLPTMPRELNVVHTDCAGKPRQPTSTGNSHQVCYPRSLHRVCRSMYLAFSIHMRSGTFPPKVLSVPQWKGAM